jgi:hypothetical protein
MEGNMPEYEVSTEARWLASNWPNLEEYVGRWIAVVGERVEFAATGFPEVAAWAEERDLHPLFVYVLDDNVV